jgi:hypothetical protein
VSGLEIFFAVQIKARSVVYTRLPSVLEQVLNWDPDPTLRTAWFVCNPPNVNIKVFP